MALWTAFDLKIGTQEHLCLLALKMGKIERITACGPAGDELACS
jgi:hypothetical protein